MVPKVKLDLTFPASTRDPFGAPKCTQVSVDGDKIKGHALYNQRQDTNVDRVVVRLRGLSLPDYDSEDDRSESGSEQILFDYQIAVYQANSPADRKLLAGSYVWPFELEFPSRATNRGMTDWWLPYADSSKEKLFEHHVGHGLPPTFSFLKSQLGWIIVRYELSASIDDRMTDSMELLYSPASTIYTETHLYRYGRFQADWAGKIRPVIHGTNPSSQHITLAEMPAEKSLTKERPNIQFALQLPIVLTSGKEFPPATLTLEEFPFLKEKISIHYVEVEITQRTAARTIRSGTGPEWVHTSHHRMIRVTDRKMQRGVPIDLNQKHWYSSSAVEHEPQFQTCNAHRSYSLRLRAEFAVDAGRDGRWTFKIEKDDLPLQIMGPYREKKVLLS